MNFKPKLYENKKSKFYSYLFEISSKDQINDLREILLKEHKKARHICYAYHLSIGDINSSGFDDDGEPSGTAGRPIKELMQKRNINNCVIFIVRYFGGIKLGGGGLIRSYVKSANLKIEEYLTEK
ncbi:UNVERIFIED_CONTAM: YigZ family protein [Campylobacter lari]